MTDLSAPPEGPESLGMIAARTIKRRLGARITRDEALALGQDCAEEIAAAIERALAGLPKYSAQSRRGLVRRGS